MIEKDKNVKGLESADGTSFPNSFYDFYKIYLWRVKIER